MQPRNLVTLFATTAFALVLSGCDLTSPYEAPAIPPVPAAFSEAGTNAKAAWPDQQWWKNFNTPELTALIEQARAHNYDLAAAVARVQQADAQARTAKAFGAADRAVEAKAAHDAPQPGNTPAATLAGQ